MPTKPSKLEAQFQQFRGDKASAESAWIGTAILISQYADKSKSVTAIKQDFALQDQSPIAIQFSSLGKRTMGSLLYGKLALDNYRENLPDGQEKQLCSEISTILGELYGAAQENRNKLGPLLSKTNEWLTNHLANSPNKEQAQELMKGMFTMFSCLKLKLSNIPSAVGFIPGATALVTLAQTEIPKLMTEIERQAQILEPQVEQIKLARASQERSMEESFNDRYLDILGKEGESQTTKLAALGDAAAQTAADVESLLAKKQEKAQLEQDISQLQVLLSKANDNDTRISGRLYFHDFVKTNQEGYDVLRKVHPNQTKPLEELRKTIVAELGGAKNTALYLASVVSSPLTILSRATGLAGAVKNITPDTYDSQAKRDLITLTTAALVDMHAQVKARNEEILGLESKLAKGNNQLQRKLEDATTEDLQKIATISTISAELAREGKKVCQPIEATGEKLEKIKQLSKAASDFITINDNALSKIGDWFARFGRWFQTQPYLRKLQRQGFLSKSWRVNTPLIMNNLMNN